MSRSLRAGLLLTAALAAPAAAESPVDAACMFKGVKLQGKVQIVTSFPDLTIEAVQSFPDLKVQMVEAFPDACGRWQIVESHPDFKVQFVDSFPDLKVQFVESFPGVP